MHVRRAETRRGPEPPLLCRSADSGHRPAASPDRSPKLLPFGSRIRGRLGGLRPTCLGAEAPEPGVAMPPASLATSMAGSPPDPLTEVGVSCRACPSFPRTTFRTDRLRLSRHRSAVGLRCRVRSPVVWFNCAYRAPTIPPHLTMFGNQGTTCTPGATGLVSPAASRAPKCPFRGGRQSRRSFDLGGPSPSPCQRRSAVSGPVVAVAPSGSGRPPAAAASHRSALRRQPVAGHRSPREPLWSRRWATCGQARLPVLPPVPRDPGCGHLTLPQPCRTEVRWLP